MPSIQSSKAVFLQEQSALMPQLLSPHLKRAPLSLSVFIPTLQSTHSPTCRTTKGCVSPSCLPVVGSQAIRKRHDPALWGPTVSETLSKKETPHLGFSEHSCPLPCLWPKLTSFLVRMIILQTHGIETVGITQTFRLT